MDPNCHLFRAEASAPGIHAPRPLGGYVEYHVDETLSELVEEGAVDSREVETGDGTTTYHRLA